MPDRFEIDAIAVDVVRKNIKHVHLMVSPPTGHVRISAPRRMNLASIRAFAISKLDWIRRQQRRIRARAPETARRYVDGESHDVWGRRYRLEVRERHRRPSIRLGHETILLTVRPGADLATRDAIVSAWYREQVREAALPLIAAWEARMGVAVNRCFVQRMTTRWGSCHPSRRNVRLNAELGRRPPECLEYVVVHELAHLLEPRHDTRFYAVLDRHLPTWRHARRALNESPPPPRILPRRIDV